MSLLRRPRTILATVLAVLIAALCTVLAAPPASAATISGDWGYKPHNFSGSDEITSAEYGPLINYDSIYLAPLVCVSGPCQYEPGMTVTTTITNAAIVETIGATLQYSIPGYASVGTCEVITATQLVCTINTSGSLATGQIMFVGTSTDDFHVTGGAAQGTAFTTTTWAPGSGNTTSGNDTGNDTQTVTWDLAYTGEDIGLGVNGTVSQTSTGPGTFTLTCLAAPDLNKCYYPENLHIGYINYTNGATVTSTVGTTYNLVGEGSETVGSCVVTSATRVDCDTTVARSLSIGATITATGWTESFPTGPAGTVVRADTYVPYDGYCRDPETCGGDHTPFNNVDEPRLGDVIANNTRQVALLALEPTPTPTITAPILAATGAQSSGLFELGLLVLAAGLMLVGAATAATGHRGRH